MGRANLTTPGGPGYEAAHIRVIRLRGVASTHACVDCGKGAQHWSYDHADPDERRGPVVCGGKVRTLPWSDNPTHYAPRCASCHKKFDRVFLAATKTR
jgi:hypothetical protein